MRQNVKLFTDTHDTLQCCASKSVIYNEHSGRNPVLYLRIKVLFVKISKCGYYFRYWKYNFTRLIPYSVISLTKVGKQSLKHSCALTVKCIANNPVKQIIYANSKNFRKGIKTAALCSQEEFDFLHSGFNCRWDQKSFCASKLCHNLLHSNITSVL